MRSSMLAACLLFVLLVVPAGAQAPSTQPAEAPAGGSNERIIMDVVLWALPGETDEVFLQLPAGRLAITLRAEAVGLLQPVRYTFAAYTYRAADSPTEIRADVTREARTFEATLAGGRYCYAILNEAMPTLTDEGIESAGQAQLVAIKMVLRAR